MDIVITVNLELQNTYTYKSVIVQRRLVRANSVKNAFMDQQSLDWVLQSLD